jgi:hypothetical protein
VHALRVIEHLTQHRDQMGVSAGAHRGGQPGQARQRQQKGREFAQAVRRDAQQFQPGTGRQLRRQGLQARQVDRQLCQCIVGQVEDFQAVGEVKNLARKLLQPTGQGQAPAAGQLPAAQLFKGGIKIARKAASLKARPRCRPAPTVPLFKMGG